MKKIMNLTEGDLKRIVHTVISEMALGVPDNITETANQIYNTILVRFPDSYDLNSHEMLYEVTIRDNFHVKDLSFDTVKIQLEMNEAIDPNLEITIVGATVQGGAKIVDDKIHRETDNVLNVKIRFAYGQEWNLGVVMDLIKRERSEVESMLTHEIMHKYDHFKQPETHIGNTAKYNAVQQVNIRDVDPVNKFLHLLYFIHGAEERTRSSEFYSQLKVNNITKEKFKKFFDESKMITTLKQCRDYTFAKLVFDLHNNMDGIDNFLTDVNNSAQLEEPLDLNMSDIHKINETLNLVWVMLNNSRRNIFSDILKSSINPFELMFGPDGGDAEMRKKQFYMDNFIKRTKKAKNYREFFDNEIKRLNFAGEKTIKKLSNLYAMVDNDKDSIVNWDLHHKINDTAGKTKEKLNELLSKTTPTIRKKKD